VINFQVRFTFRTFFKKFISTFSFFSWFYSAGAVAAEGADGDEFAFIGGGLFIQHAVKNRVAVFVKRVNREKAFQRP
jgi:hypothetical protein